MESKHPRPVEQDSHTRPDQPAPLPFPSIETATTIPLPEEAPITVPILSAQRAAGSSETVFDDIASRWPDNPHDDLEDERSEMEEDDALELRISDHLSGSFFPRDDRFGLRERHWIGWRRFRRTTLILMAVTLMIAVGAVGAATAVSFARHATPGLSFAPARPTVSSYNNGVVIQPGSAGTQPTPVAPKYQIGVWLSNNAPTGGTVKVFVRLSENTGAIANTPVSLVVQLPSGKQPYGPTKTDGFGLVSFTVVYGGITQTPVFVTASAKVDNQALSAETVFVPI